MANDEFTPVPFQEWSDFQQDLYLDMIADTGKRRLLDDDDLMSFYDIAFNTPRGEISGRDRDAIIEAIKEYVRDEYNFDFDRVFDWEAWREAYKSGEQ